MTLSNDLGALVIHVRSGLDTYIRSHMGRAVQHICLRAIQDSNPDLSKTLHDHHGIKAYGVSGLLRSDGQPLEGVVRRDAVGWIRLAGLQADVVDALVQYGETSPEVIMIDNRPWYVESMTWAGEWGGSTTYSDLIQKHESDIVEKYIKLRFISPTAFHSKGHNLPFPLPFLVFQSLVMRWEAFTGMVLPDNLLTFVEYFVMLSRYRGQTEILTFKQKSKQVGFVGEVEFTITRSNNKFKHKDPQLHQQLKSSYQEYALILNMLAEFAFYSGVGIKTTSGMGMVKSY